MACGVRIPGPGGGTELSETKYYADGTRAGVVDANSGAWLSRYRGSLIYSGENGEEDLEGIQTADGYIDCSNGISNAQMQYFIRDHLGSVRVIATDRNNVISPYAYCAGNPLNYLDKQGDIFETAWDLVSLSMGVASFVSNVKSRKVGPAIIDGIGIVADAAAVALPFVPGGISAGIKAAKGAVKGVDSAVDAIKGADKALDAAKALDKSLDVAGSIDKGVNATKSAKTIDSAKSLTKSLNGETIYTRYGRQAHKDYNPGANYEKEFRLPSGRRVDAIVFQNGVVRELKPDNPKANKLGERQIQGYIKELELLYPDKKWTGVVDTYKRP